MKYRRFGRTELQMPVISCGCMRFQYSWNDKDPQPPESDRNVAACLRRALELGITHIETARGYGTSEEQVGKALPEFQRDTYMLQTKIGPKHDVAAFEADFEKSMRLLGADYLDLMSFHGINNQDTLEATWKCLDTARAWQRQGRIRHIGFATHCCLPNRPELIESNAMMQAIRSGEFDYVNLHWFYVQQNNWPAIEAARKKDMGVFIISPNDKGGKLYSPSAKFSELCAPLPPMVFNGLYCLAHPEINTLSCGVARPEDFDLHLETAERSEEAQRHIASILERLDTAMRQCLGRDWVETWNIGLPEWDETPGNLNIPVMLRLYNLARSFDMVEYAKMRYNLLGNGDHWFPGERGDKLGELDLTACLAHSPNAAKIPGILREAHALLADEAVKRLQQDAEDA